MKKLLPVVVLLCGAAFAETPGTVRLFELTCVSCHAKAQTPPIPDPTALRQMTPEAIYQVLNADRQHVEALPKLTDAEKRDVAEYASGRQLMDRDAGEASKMMNVCKTNPPITSLTSAPAWNGWSADRTNGRFQAAASAGLTKAQIPRLKLKWAFGFPGATSVHGQPAIAAGRVFVGLNNGYIYSLDASSGCAYWSFQARADVRNAISIGEANGQGAAKFAVYFGDVRANVYALDAATGRQLWQTKVDHHGLASITGAPALYEGRLYVPVASREEQSGVALTYPCCTFRGSVVALDANTGKQIWKTFTIPDEPKPTRKNSAGTQLWAPAGGGVWNTPTIDPKQHALYVGTGNSYTQPAQPMTDAILALDLDTGKVLWVKQDTPKDAWLVCFGAFGKTENCPEDMGPDYDFGASPILRTLPNGRRILVAGQKGGVVWAHDPDRKGALVWKTQIPEKESIGEITFGGAADDESAYFGVSSVGVVALRLTDGTERWVAPVKAAGPRLGIGAALSVAPGVVFSGGYDGMLRVFSTTDGELLWQFNMLQDFKTVNGVAAKGGSMGQAGPVVVGGTLFAGSGYIFGARGTPGNVLLAFTAQ